MLPICPLQGPCNAPLAPRNFRQIGIVPDIGVALCELRYWHGDNLLVTASLIRHLKHADWTHGDDSAWDNWPGIGDQDVAGIAIFREGMRDEAIVPGIAHGRIKKAVD